MLAYMVLNPHGNEGKGRITRYVGRGAGITARMELIDLLVEANRHAQTIVQEAEEGGAEFADLSSPMMVATVAINQLRNQAESN